MTEEKRDCQMRNARYFKNALALCLVTMTSGVGVAAWADEIKKPVAIPQVSNDWRGSITPYLWALNVNGSVYHGGNELVSANIDTSSLLSTLNMGAMLIGEVHKGNWGLSADLMYADITKTSSRPVGNYVDLGSKTSLSLGIYTVTASYTLHNSKDVYLDALLGARVLNNNGSTSFNVDGYPLLRKNINTTVTDPVVGVKGRFRISDSEYFVPFYVDVGGGGGNTQVTTQAYLGVGRAFDWGDVELVVKNLYYKQKNQGVTSNLDLFGAGVGVTFKF